MSDVMNGGAGSLLRRIQTEDFALYEVALYLDAYPTSQEALEYYHKLMQERDQVCDYYQKNCGPLTIYGNKSKTSWDWISAPWPWEADAN